MSPEVRVRVRLAVPPSPPPHSLAATFSNTVRALKTKPTAANAARLRTTGFGEAQLLKGGAPLPSRVGVAGFVCGGGGTMCTPTGESTALPKKKHNQTPLQRTIVLQGTEKPINSNNAEKLHKTQVASFPFPGLTACMRTQRPPNLRRAGHISATL